MADARVSGAQSCGQPYSGFRSAHESYFVATAIADTVPTAEGGVFGQVADIERLGGSGTDDAQVDNVSRGLLVPWGFDAQCRPIRWSGSWQWSNPGSRGFYRGRLRSRRDWVDGRPTIDVYGAAWEGFPASPWSHPMAAGMPKLSADELYDLYDRLPTREEVVDRPYGAVSALVEWRREAGVVADRYPAPTILEAAFEVAEVVRVRQEPIPFAGTYRIGVESGGDTLASFWLRTGESGAAPWSPARTVGQREVSASPAPSGAVAAPASLASRMDALENAAPACERKTALGGSETATTIGENAHGWRAELSLSLVASCFPDDEVLSELTRAPGSPDSDDSGPFPGAFLRENDGRFSFRQPAVLSDGTEVELVGERIDVRTLPAVDPLEGWAEDGAPDQRGEGAEPGQAN